MPTERQPYVVRPGDAPLVVSMPHVGTEVPEAIARRMTDAGRGVPDTDWHVDRLYDFLEELGVGHIAAIYARYVVDLNRPPDGRPLYPGASETELCPTTTFAEQPIYLEGQGPDAAEVEERRVRYWQPYHDALAELVDAALARHGRVVLWDAHSIRSRVPRFFSGRLPDLNLGTRGGTTAHPMLIAELAEVASEAEELGYGYVVDGRFKGGYITATHGRPQEARHAVQLELAQAAYMDEDPPYTFRDDLARELRPVLCRLLETALAWARG